MVWREWRKDLIWTSRAPIAEFPQVYACIGTCIHDHALPLVGILTLLPSSIPYNMILRHLSIAAITTRINETALEAMIVDDNHGRRTGHLLWARLLHIFQAAVILATDARVRVMCPGTHPHVDRLEQGVEVWQARTDDADIKFKPRPYPDFNKIRCTNARLTRLVQSQMTSF